MFAKLHNAPAAAIHAAIESTMFAPELVIFTTDADGDAIEKRYGWSELHDQPGFAEAIQLTRDGKDYLVGVTEDGLHGCSCEAFTYVNSKIHRPCKHLAALYAVGLLTKFKPQYEEKHEHCTSTN